MAVSMRAVLFVLLVCSSAANSAPLSVPDLRTPSGAMKTLLRAAQTGDTRLWSACLSRTDRTAADVVTNPEIRRRYDEQRRRDTRDAGPLGDTYYDYLFFQPVFSVTGKEGIPADVVAMAHVLAENVWDDAYAEVTLILPLEVRGYQPPMTFCFLKEEGEWKLCQWLTTAILLGWDVGREPQFEAKIATLLRAHTGTDFHRRDCSRVIRTTFPVTAEVSAAYRAAVEAGPALRKSGLLWLWALTGDEAARRMVAEVEAADPKAEISAALEKYKKMALGPSPCGPRPAVPGIPPVDPESPAFVFRASEQDIIALRVIPDRFPAERGWGVKAGVRAAELLAGNGSPDAAVDEYLKTAARFPDQVEESAKARGLAAGLLWDELGRQADAIAIWRQLKAEGRLPADAVFDEARPVTPVTLLQDGETGFRLGIEDFDVLPDGGLLVTRVVVKPAEKSTDKQPHAEVRLDLHDARGVFVRSLPDSGIAEVPHALYRSNAGLFLETHSKLIRMDGEGIVHGELVNWFKNFEVRPGLHIGAYGTSSSAQFPEAIAAMDDRFAVLYWDSLRTFDFQGSLLRTVPVPFCDVWGNARGRMVASPRGDLVFTQPERGKVVRVDEQGNLVPMQPPALPTGEFGDIAHFFSDEADNFYIVSKESRRILKFSKAGTFVRHFDAGVAEPTSGAAGADGKVYLVGYGFDGGDTICVFAEDGVTAGTIHIRTDDLHEGNGNILDLEVAGEAVYVVVGSTVAKADRSGRILSSFRVPGESGHGVPLTKDRQGSIYFPVGNEVWLYDGEHSRPVATLSAKEPRSAIFAAAVDAGTVHGLIGGSALVTYDSQTKLREQLNLPRGPGPFPGRFLIVDRDGNRYLAYPDAPEVRRVAPDGTMSAFVGGSKAAPKVWVPSDVALDRDNAVFVLDTQNRALLKFLPDGTFSARCDLGRYRLGWFRRMRIDGANRLYLLTNSNQKKNLVRFDLGELFPRDERERATHGGAP